MIKRKKKIKRMKLSLVQQEKMKALLENDKEIVKIFRFCDGELKTENLKKFDVVSVNSSINQNQEQK